MNKLLFYIVFVLVSVSVFSQKERFEYYSIQDGLIQSRVKDIIQDKDGYVWFATNGGVSRYDGNEFINYTTKEGLVNNRISRVFEGRNGDVWVATLFGLSRIEFDQFKNKYVIQNITKKEGLVSNAVYAINQVNDSIFWVGTARGINELVLSSSDSTGFKKIAKVKALYNNKNGLLSNSINDIVVDDSRNVWISYNGSGVSMFDSRRRTFEHFGINEGMSSNTINDLFIDKDQNVWCASGNGVNLIVRSELGGYTVYNSSNISQIKDLNIRSITQDFNGDILVASNKIFKLRYNQLLIQDYPIELVSIMGKKNGLSEYTILSLFQDHEKNIWIGTFNFGAISYTYSGFQFLDQDFNFSNQRIQDIYEDKSRRVWVATGDYLNIVTPLPNNEYKVELIDKDHKGNKLPKSYRVIHEDSKGYMWFGSTEGLIEYHSGKYTRYSTYDGLTHNFVQDIYEDSEGNLWFATFGGVSLLSKEQRNSARKEFKNYTIKDGLPHNQVTSIIENEKGHILFGTRKGLVKYDGYLFQTFNKDDGLINNFITSIKKDKKGRVWLVTASGLSLFEDDKFKNYTTKEGLNSDTPYLLEIDDLGHVWVGTNKGLNELKLNDRDSIENVKHYGLDNEIMNSEFNSGAVMKDSRGVLWFGMQTGILKFDRSLFCNEAEEPKVKINQVRVFLKSFDIPSDRTFSYDENHITFDFIGFGYNRTDKVKYQYKLEGLDKDWFPVTEENFATWSNIPHGKYTFLLKACSKNGIWNEEPVKYDFRIIPPFWKTKWFIILCVITFGGGLFAAVKYRLRRLEIARKLLQFKVLERTKELKEKNNQLVKEQDKTKKVLEELRLRDKDITDSLNYAKRIQEAIMPPDEIINEILPKSFVYFKPKGIVSGDFFWIHEEGDDLFVTVVDCTGHGVPGALMSIVGFKLLVQAVNIKGLIKPAEILFEMNKGVRGTLRQTTDEDSVKDGMDVSLVKYNKKTRVVEYAGAFNPLYYVRNGEMNVLRGNRFPIGIFDGDQIKAFDNHEFQLEKGDTFYIFSDGYVDQFGGSLNKKFKYKPFREMLLQLSEYEFSEQKEKLHQRLVDWKGQNEQIDDICIIGFSLE